MSVLLHIGLHKTGTTSIQTFLRGMSIELMLCGARFPLGWLQLNNHFELGLSLLDPDRLTPSRSRGVEWRDPVWRADVAEQVADDLAEHPDVLTVFSCEELSLFRFHDEFDRLRQLVGDARVIVYVREPNAWIRSVRMQHERDFARQVTILPSALSQDRDAYNCVEPDAWIRDHAGRVESWRRHFTRVDVVDYDQAVAADGSVLPSFCRALGLPLPPVDVWQNRTGTVNEGRVPGTRWTGGRFGRIGPDVLDAERLAAYLDGRGAA